MSYKFLAGEARHALVNKLPGLFHRGLHGWAKHDTWSFDKYLARVIAEGLEHMAKHTNGTPCFIFDQLEYDPSDTNPQHDKHAAKVWEQWLIDKARWFRWYYEENIGLTENMTDEQRISCLDFWEKQEQHFNDVVLPDFWKNFGSLWD